MFYSEDAVEKRKEKVFNSEQVSFLGVCPQNQFMLIGFVDGAVEVKDFHASNKVVYLGDKNEDLGPVKSILLVPGRSERMHLVIFHVKAERQEMQLSEVYSVSYHHL